VTVRAKACVYPTQYETVHHNSHTIPPHVGSQRHRKDSIFDRSWSPQKLTGLENKHECGLFS
ncbi:MAG: hypothetical protein ACXV44_09135, partial [Halobacteriota archaeon]